MARQDVTFLEKSPKAAIASDLMKTLEEPQAAQTLNTINT